MNTYHKWLSGRSRRERCFKQVICFEPKNVFHMFAISIRKIETCTFLYTGSSQIWPC